MIEMKSHRAQPRTSHSIYFLSFSRAWSKSSFNHVCFAIDKGESSETVERDSVLGSGLGMAHCVCV